jgi:hypothetical protein
MPDEIHALLARGIALGERLDLRGAAECFKQVLAIVG